MCTLHGVLASLRDSDYPSSWFLGPCIHSCLKAHKSYLGFFLCWYSQARGKAFDRQAGSCIQIHRSSAAPALHVQQVASAQPITDTALGPLSMAPPEIAMSQPVRMVAPDGAVPPAAGTPAAGPAAAAEPPPLSAKEALLAAVWDYRLAILCLAGALAFLYYNYWKPSRPQHTPAGGL